MYENKHGIFELSTEKNLIRITHIQNTQHTQSLYNQVKEKKMINEIEDGSERWNMLISNKKYIFMEQRDAKGESTGFYKLVEASKSSKGSFSLTRRYGNENFKCIYIKARKEDWIYYKKEEC